MAYFVHAFQKMLLVNNAVPVLFGDEDGTGVGTVTGLDVLPGQLAVIDGKNNKVYDLAATPSYQECPMFYLAQGSHYASDKIGKFHGGYQETVKSKGINPKYVSKFYKILPEAAQNQIVEITEETANCLKCDTTYSLRIDVKGSPALRTLTRNAYLEVPAYTGCCADPQNPGTVTVGVVLEAWASYINQDPIMSEFIQATVDGTGAGDATVLTLETAYVDTRFSSCSFEKTDHFEIEPLQIYVSELLDDDHCNEGCVQIETTQEAMQGKGYGDPILKELILAKEYRQEPWKKENRMREILGETVNSDVDTTVKYVRYAILHSVPRKANPSGVMDNDQYLVTFAVPETLYTTQIALFAGFESFVNNLLTEANCEVQLEELD